MPGPSATRWNSTSPFRAKSKSKLSSKRACASHSSVDEKAKELRALAEKQGGRVRSSTFSRDPNGREVASVSLRVGMKNYPTLMQSLNSLGRVENVSVQRQDRADAQIDESNAPADVSIGLQPGQHCYRGKRLACHAAAYTWLKARAQLCGACE